MLWYILRNYFVVNYERRLCNGVGIYTYMFEYRNDVSRRS